MCGNRNIIGEVKRGKERRSNTIEVEGSECIADSEQCSVETNPCPSLSCPIIS